MIHDLLPSCSLCMQDGPRESRLSLWRGRQLSSKGVWVGQLGCVQEAKVSDIQWIIFIFQYQEWILYCNGIHLYGVCGQCGGCAT